MTEEEKDKPTRKIRDLPGIRFSASENSSIAFRKHIEEAWGIKVEVVSSAEAEDADFVACVTIDTPKYYDDDLYTTCADCGIAIRHRPHAPKKPKKICVKCATINMELYKRKSHEDSEDT